MPNQMLAVSLNLVIRRNPTNFELPVLNHVINVLQSLDFLVCNQTSTLPQWLQELINDD